jgi:two-component system OmpR family sensor kinase
LPIRIKLTLAFAGVMTLVLTAVGASLYLRFQDELDASVDSGLRARADDVAALAREGDPGLGEAGGPRLTEQGEDFAQLLDVRGGVLDGSPPLRGRPALGPAALARARRGTTTIDGLSPVDHSEPTRILATPIRAGTRRLIVAVGTSLDDRNVARHQLLTLLLIGGPVALILASLAGYGVAAASLRPVEAMRRRAAEIGDAEPGSRLPVPVADDEISRLGETLNAMLSRLEAAIARERTFVGDASHELRTPLAILKAELELALRQGRTPQELRDALESAAEETDRLSRLADDLLVIARSDGGRLPVRLESVGVAELLGRVAARYSERAAAEGRTVAYAAPPGLHLSADPLRLEQALGNVVDNALRHGAGAVHLGGIEVDGAVVLEVTDEGPGFPPAFADQAFERFTRADDARGRAGSGLGLAIVRAIAVAHGGRAEAAGGPHGAKVRIELPTGAGSDTDPPMPPMLARP